MIFEQYFNVHFQFDWTSALKCITCLIDTHTEAELLTLSKAEFVYCQMTNLEDLEESKKYFHLKFVEFLEFISRVTLIYHDLRQTNGALKPPLDVEDKVFEVLEILWELKIADDKKKPKLAQLNLAGGRKRKKRVKLFPELQPPVFEDSDEY